MDGQEIVAKRRVNLKPIMSGPPHKARRAEALFSVLTQELTNGARRFNIKWIIYKFHTRRIVRWKGHFECLGLISASTLGRLTSSCM